MSLGNRLQGVLGHLTGYLKEKNNSILSLSRSALRIVAGIPTGWSLQISDLNSVPDCCRLYEDEKEIDDGT